MKTSFTREDWLEFDLRRAAFHEAAHAVVAYEFGEWSEIHLHEDDGDSEVQTIVSGCRIRVPTPSNEMMQLAELAQRQYEATGKLPESPIIDDLVIIRSPRQWASVCVAGIIAEFMLSANSKGESFTADELIDFIDYNKENALSPSDWAGIRSSFSDPVSDRGFWELAEQTTQLLKEKWYLVQGLAEHLINLFHCEGFAVLTGGRFAEVMRELVMEPREGSCAGAEHPNLEI
jgi:hypothetical protein